MINAHTHSDWFGSPCLARGDGMVPWIRRVLTAARPIAAATRLCADAMAAQEVTAIGDFATRGSAVTEGLIAGRHYREILRNSPLPDPRPDALAPHAVHTVPRETLEALTGFAGFLSIHAGESPEEMLLYSVGTGPMADLLVERGIDRASVARLQSSSPMRVLDELGLLSPRIQIVHAVHLTDGDFRLIAERGAHIVLCPVSNREIGNAFTDALMERSGAAVRRMIELGISLALGTDSPLSCSTVSLKENARLLGRAGVPAAETEKMLWNRAAIGI